MKKVSKKTISFILTLCLLLGLMPIAAFAAGTGDMENGKRSIEYGLTNSIGGYDNSNGYDYIYFGKWNEVPVKWRVLSGNGMDTMLLLSEDLLDVNGQQGIAFDDDSNDWTSSAAKQWCDAFYSQAFIDSERELINAETSINDMAYTSSSGESFNSLSSWGESVFFLSAEQVENASNGFGSNDDRKAFYANEYIPNSWWLRSSTDSGQAGYVDENGEIKAGSVSDNKAVRPALNLGFMHRENILFTSVVRDADGMVQEGKMGMGPVNIIDPNAKGLEWKFTLLDHNRSEFRVTNAITNGSMYKISYTGAVEGPNEYISVVTINNMNNNVEYYQKVPVSQRDGVVTFDIPTFVPTSQRLYVFNEQYNGLTGTDYASQLCQVKLVARDDIMDPGSTEGWLNIDFGRENEGYPISPERNIIIQNISQDLISLNVSALNNYSATLTQTQLGPNAETTLTIQPNLGLSQGIYEEDFEIMADSMGTPSNGIKIHSIFVVDPAPEHEITLSAEPEIGGSVSGGGMHKQNQEITVTATANQGYHFVRWTENGSEVSTNASYTFTVTEPRNLVAVFEADVPTGTTYNITVSASPTEGGTATITGNGTYNENEEVTVTATENSDYHFVKWTKGGVEVSKANPYTFSATESCELVAVFEANAPSTGTTYNITVSASPTEGGNATITGNGTYNENESVTVTATAEEDYHFVNWTKGGKEVSKANPYTFSATESCELVANFEKDGEGTPSPKKYSVTVDAGTGATGAGDYEAGTTVQIYAGTKSNYSFNGWTSEDGVAFADASNATTTFTMPDKNVTVTANWKYNGGGSGGSGGGTSNKYTVDVESTGDGTVESNKDKANKGETVTITTEGSVESITVVDKNGDEITVTKNDDGDYTFKMPGSSVTVTVEFETEDEEMADTDSGVADSDVTGVADLLDTVEHKAYMHGYDTGVFAPNNNITRAEVAQSFYNLMLNKTTDNIRTFADVPENMWYYDAITVLAGEGIISGYEDGQFRPNQPITRAEFTSIAARFAKASTEKEIEFSDVQEEVWYKDAVQTAVSYGWINGYDDGTFRPNQSITRAETVTIINNMLNRNADKTAIDDGAGMRFPDVTVAHWAFYNIVEATTEHEYSRDSNIDMEKWI